MITRCTIPGEVASASVEDGTVLLHLGTKRYFSLNDTGAEIWSLIEQDVPLGEIPARLTAAYDVPIADARVAVAELLAALAEQGLVSVEAE
ncbi:MAG TPA: PqqD family protein [Gemmatimonadaceae bacterium]|nr:PqqD family protein [Gemmatimonadaceae bacterium]